VLKYLFLSNIIQKSVPVVFKLSFAFQLYDKQ